MMTATATGRLDAMELLGRPTRRASTGEGTVDLWIKPGLLVGQVSGYLGSSLAQDIMEASEEVLAISSGAIVGLHNWLGLSRYDIAVQAELSGYILKRMRHFRRVLIAVESPLVSMGVRTANVVVRGSLDVVKTHGDFEAALREEMARLRQSIPPA